MLTTANPPGSLTTAGAAFAAFARSGDQAALDPVLGPCVDAALGQAHRLLGNQQDAADVTQEALLQAMHSAHRYDPSRPFAPWFAVIVHRSCNHWLRSRQRSRRRERSVALDAVRSSAPEEADPGIDADLVRAAVAGLREPEREAVSLHYFAGLSQEQVAQVLHLTPNAVAVRLHRARERLRLDLVRRGCAGAASAITAGLTTPTPAVPAALARQCADQVRRMALPGRPGALGSGPRALRRTVQQLGRHALATGLAGGVLVVLGAAWWRAAPADRLPDAPPAAAGGAQAAVPLPWWDAAAQADLRALDPQCRLHAAVDLDALRRVGATTRPSSLFADPLAQAWVGRMAGLLSSTTMAPVWQVIAGGHRLVVNQQDQAGSAAADSGAMSERGLYVLNARQPVLDLLTLPTPPGAKPLAVGTMQVDQLTAQCWQGRSGQRLAVGSPSLVSWLAQGGNLAARPPEDLAAPAWLRFDAGPLLDAFDRLGALDADAGGIGQLLGPGWRTLVRSAGGHVRIQIQLLPQDGVWTTRTRILGLHPFPSTLPLFACAPVRPWMDLLGYVHGRPCRADLAALVPDHPLASLVLGFDGVATPEVSDLPLVSVDGSSPPAVMRALRGLVATWSGDLACWLTPAPGLPAVHVVLGLRPGQDGATAFSLLAVALGARAANPEPGSLACAGGYCPLGAFTWMRTADRLIFSTGPRPASGSMPVQPAAAAAAPGHDLDLTVDLPRLLPLIAMLCALDGVPADDLPPQAVLARHLTPWTFSADDRADGVMVHESGLPLASLFIVLACGEAAAHENPAADIATMHPDVDLRLALSAARLQACALYRIGHQLNRVSHPDSTNYQLSWYDNDACASLSAWCDEHHIEPAAFAPLAGGRTPLPAGLDQIGTWWSGVPAVQGWVIEDEAAETLGQVNVISANHGFNVWLMPIAEHPGWWIGMVDGVPVLTDHPPRTPSTPAAQRAFN